MRSFATSSCKNGFHHETHFSSYIIGLQVYQIICEVIYIIEIKIPKEIRKHKESIFLGLSARQFICSALAVGIAVATYLFVSGFAGKETASWLCILLAAPAAIAGFFQYNGMTLEQFIVAYIKTEFLCAGKRKYVSHSLHYEVMGRKEAADFD